MGIRKLKILYLRAIIFINSVRAFWGSIMINVRSLHNCNIQGWKLSQIIGEGADGVVYKGEKNSVIRAVKIYFPDVLQNNGYETGLQRLALQLTLKEQEQHPNLVEIYEGGEAPEVNSLYLVMQLVPGAPLEDVIKDIPEENISSLIGQLADAAKFLEDQGIVHRDIKPSNIVISKDFSKLTLLDLGVALRTAEEIERLSGDNFVGTTRYNLFFR